MAGIFIRERRILVSWHTSRFQISDNALELMLRFFKYFVHHLPTLCSLVWWCCHVPADLSLLLAQETWTWPRKVYEVRCLPKLPLLV